MVSPAVIFVVSASTSLPLPDERSPSLLERNGVALMHFDCADRALLEARGGAAAPGAFVVDLDSPDSDAWAFLGRRRADPALAATPVIAMSSRAELADAARGLGVIDCIGKPLSPNELVRALRTAAVLPSPVRRVRPPSPGAEANGSSAAAGPKDLAASYSIFVRFHQKRLALVKRIPDFEAAIARMLSIRAERFHGADDVFLVDDVTGATLDVSARLPRRDIA